MDISSRDIITELLQEAKWEVDPIGSNHRFIKAFKPHSWAYDRIIEIGIHDHIFITIRASKQFLIYAESTINLAKPNAIDELRRMLQ